MGFGITKTLLVLCILACGSGAQAQVWMLKDLAIPTKVQSIDMGDICPRCLIHGPVTAEVLTTDAVEARFLNIGDTLLKELMTGSVPVFRGKAFYKNPTHSRPLLYRQDVRRNPEGGVLFSRTMPDGSYIYAVWAYRPSSPQTERTLSLFWQYPGSQVHSVELVGSEDEERYGQAAVEFSQTRIVVRNDAFGICFETDQKKGKRFVTYWPDSGSFSFSKKPAEAGKPASVLEVEAVAPLLR